MVNWLVRLNKALAGRNTKRVLSPRSTEYILRNITWRFRFHSVATERGSYCHTDVLLQARECDSLKTLLVRKPQQLVLWRTLRTLIAEIIPDQLWRARSWISLGQFHAFYSSHPEMNESENFADDLWFPLYLEREYEWIKRWAQEAVRISEDMTDERQLREQTPLYSRNSTLHTALKETRHSLSCEWWLFYNSPNST